MLVSNIFKKLWPYLVGLAMFILISSVIRDHLDVFRAVLNEESTGYAMTIYVLLGILTVMIPFGSLVPFIPLATLLWGWPMAGLLTFLSWVLGSQILFEGSRFFGKRFAAKLLSESQLHAVADMVHDKGMAHALLLRMFVHGDIVSYAFGIFTHISRWNFLWITAVGVAPGAFVYAYFGSLPFVYQVSMAVLGLVILTAYWILESKMPSFLKLMARHVRSLL